MIYFYRFHVKIATLVNAIEGKQGSLDPSLLIERSTNRELHQRTYFWCVQHVDDQINNQRSEESISPNDVVVTDEHLVRAQDDNVFFLNEDENYLRSGGLVDNFNVIILRTAIEIFVDIACLITVVFTLMSPMRIFELMYCILISPKKLSVWCSVQCMRKVLVMDQVIQEFKVEISRELSNNIKEVAHTTTRSCRLDLKDTTVEKLYNKYLESFKNTMRGAKRVGKLSAEGTEKMFAELLPARVNLYEQLLFHYCIMMTAKQQTITLECMENQDLRERLSIVVQIMNEKLNPKGWEF